jgi:hypothetical protein
MTQKIRTGPFPGNRQYQPGYVFLQNPKITKGAKARQKLLNLGPVEL